jgi:tetratricopeptide (TPR) repeat protein
MMVARGARRARVWMARARLAVVLTVLGVTAPARAADESERSEAVRAFQQGNTHYDLGEYQEAIPFFRRAYEISREPALIFNIAQAYRLAGDCHRALETYGQFLRVTSDAALRSAAQAHSETLRQSCGTPASTASPASTVVATPPPPSQTWRRMGQAGVGIGILTGAGAVALYAVNGPRYQRWRDENDRLRTRQVTDPAEAFRRQQSNDDLWRSIERTDGLALGLAITGAALTVAGGLVWWLSPPRERSVALAFTGTGATMTLAWR